MENRFFDMNAQLKQISGKKCRSGSGSHRLAGAKGIASFQSSTWIESLSATDRVLVILIENGGVELGIPTLVDKLLSTIPGASMISDDMRQQLVDLIKEKIKSFTDNLLESAELSINRYAAAKPSLFSDVVVLRDGAASYEDLKRTLIGLSRAGKIIDLIILTHGRNDMISVTGEIDGQKIRAMRNENGKPLSIRSVYMMNCQGSSLNQAWIDAGAKVSSGALRINYLPEPSTYFFWSNWKEGQAFENAVTSAYRKTINLMNAAVRSLVGSLPIPGISLLASQIDFETMDFVKDSAPVIQGQRSVTINSDALSFSESISSSLTTTVLPASVLRALSEAPASSAAQRRPGTVSRQAIDLIKKWQQPYDSGISDEKATQSLVQKASRVQQVIDANVQVPLTQNQNDALLSFVYNVGERNFHNSTLLRLLNQGNYAAVPDELRKWVKIRQNGRLVESPDLIGRRTAEAGLFTAAETAAAQSISDRYSVPFYDTGEHAILGEFINNAVSGPLVNVGPLQPTTTFPINTVPFTYGQIITMGDFYDTYASCEKASVAELTRLKTLITRSENHYKNSILGIGSLVADVSNVEWASPTIGIGPRFLDLALKNNSHFAPPAAGTSTTQPNNKKSWEEYHGRAIQTARAGAGSAVLNAAYPINAFGDHFLTDAFSAGHLFNKELVMKTFVKNVISGGSVNAAGEKLFELVANGALAKPHVNQKLGRYELVETHLGIHLNLNTDLPLMRVFQGVLRGVMEDTANGGQEQISNLAAKAAHDFLNTYQSGGVRGVPVKNRNGNAWNLTGDGTLNLDNIKVIQLAVKQSVENIEDAVANPSTPLSTYFQRVWDYVPDLTDPVTRKIVDDAVAVFTNPSSSQLVAKAIDLVEHEIDTLLGALLRAGIIQLDV